MNDLPQQPAPKDVSPDESTALGLSFAWELGYTIAIPVVLLGVGGAYLDRFLGVSPLFTLLGFMFAFLITIVSLTKKIRAILARMPGVLPKKPDEEEQRKTEGELLHEQFRPKS